MKAKKKSKTATLVPGLAVREGEGLRIDHDVLRERMKALEITMDNILQRQALTEKRSTDFEKTFRGQQESTAAVVGVIGKELRSLIAEKEFGGKYVDENWVPNKAKNTFDYYPTKRDLHVLRSRVSGLSHGEITTILTQMLERWEAIHG